MRGGGELPLHYAPLPKYTVLLEKWAQAHFFVVGRVHGSF